MPDKRPTITMVAALTRNHVIGKNNDLPWRLPADLAHFKRLTLGKPIILGRKNYQSIGRPLPGRHNIVITRDRTFSADGVTVVHSPADALRAAGNVDEVMIIGGADIYRQFLPQADRLHLTWIEADIDGDTYFPDFSTFNWQRSASEQRPADDNNPHPMTFETYQRLW